MTVMNCTLGFDAYSGLGELFVLAVHRYVYERVRTEVHAVFKTQLLVVKCCWHESAFCTYLNRILARESAG